VQRIVVDPGVLVSAIITPSGPPAEIVPALRVKRFRLVVCPHLLADLLGVLRREKFRGYSTIDEAEHEVAVGRSVLPQPFLRFWGRTAVGGYRLERLAEVTVDNGASKSETGPGGIGTLRRPVALSTAAPGPTSR
jgi:hypothetical protein